jgi:putative ABC transport system permease protein
MRIAFRKVWRDIIRNKSRTLLVVISIAVGVTAIGMIFSTNRLLSQQMTLSQKASQPSSGKLYLDRSIDDETLHSLLSIPGIEQVEGAIESSIRWKLTLDADWKQDRANLIARSDYENQSFDVVTLRSGSWPDIKSIDVEFNHVKPFGIPDIGETIYFEVNNRPDPWIIGGTLRDPSQFPPPNAQAPSFYVTRDIMERLGGTRDSNVIRFSIPEYNKDKAEIAVDQIKTKLRKLGVSVTYYEVQDPNHHPMQDIINGIGLVLALMAVMSLGLSTFLVINTINAVIIQQIPQIGVMKALGGVKREIAVLYLAFVGIYGLMSLVIAVPVGAIGGYAISNWLLQLLNVPPSKFEILGISFFFQVLAGLLAPLLAAIFPVLRGASTTVKDAISSYGIGANQYGKGLIDRFLGQIRGLPRLAALPLRNTFRSFGRVVLTQITLVGAGALFLTVLSTGNSVTNTIISAMDSFGFDIMLVFKNPQRITEIIDLAESRSSVEHAEMWIWRDSTARVPGTTGPGTAYEIKLRGFPRNTQFYSPRIVDGKNLDLESEQNLLINQKLANDMGLKVGDQIALDLGGERDSIWTISGLVEDLTASQTTAYMYLDVLSAKLNQTDRASVVEIKLKGVEKTSQAQEAAIKDLQDFFTSQGIEVVSSSGSVQQKEQAAAQLNILITVLLVMTVLVAIVGSVGLSGTLSINVIERTREIGVMRAVGASSGDIGLIFVGEGLIYGLLSWVLAVPISFGTGNLFVKVFGSVVGVALRYYFSFTGIWIWLLIVTVLSLLASWLPAMRATKISVAKSLAYE